MVSHGTIIGRTHRLLLQNCHDFACTGELDPGYGFGLVLDGCGSKYRDEESAPTSHNEIGAKLLGRFAVEFLTKRLGGSQFQQGQHSSELISLSEELYRGSLVFLEHLLKLIPLGEENNRRRFIGTHLLTTLLGFLITPEAAVFFWLGDGFLCKDNESRRIDNCNRPDYLAYRLLSGDISPSKKEAGFQVELITEFHSLSMMAVATDGWRTDLLQGLSTPRSSLALQRWINHKARDRGNFDDDGAAAVWWRIDSQAVDLIKVKEVGDIQ